MIRYFMVGVAVLAVTAVSCGRTSLEPEPSGAAPAIVGTSGEEVEAQVAQLEREWVAAIVQKDAATLDRLLAEDFTGTSPSAHLYTKKMAIEDLTRATYVVDAMNMDEIAVKPYGDVAVAFASQQEKSRYGSEDISGHYHYTNVWLKKDGRWQVVSSHGSRFDTAH
jgi:ketosteroid isomerase-like protein